MQVYGYPNLESAEVIKTSLENYTGPGTIYALEVKSQTEGQDHMQKYNSKQGKELSTL